MGNTTHNAQRRLFLRRLIALSVGASAALTSPRVFAGQPVVVSGVRFSAADGATRVVFDLSGASDHSIFSLHGPERVVLDLKNARVRDALDLFALPNSVVRQIRHAPRNTTDLRVVLDLKSAVKPRSFLLKPDPGSGAGYRLVVDLETGSGAQQPVLTANGADTSALRDVIVAIDAGHGGRDPGAVGKLGTREKDVVLAVARKLEALLKKEKGIQPVLIRSGDEYLALRERIRRARVAKADLFVSIHADASPDSRVQGSSVYVLSQNGASSEAARWLAERENSADLIGGVSLDDKDELLASVLLDLSQSATIEASMDLAGDMLAELDSVGQIRRRRIEQAGFAVLKSPDIPSVLVETAFISNPTEEKRLRTPAHQQKLAEALRNGVVRYFRGHAPPGTWLAQARDNRYVIRNGDTLSHIADRFRVSINDLRSVNGLRNDRLQVGQVLMIPSSDT
jgi:N-acetylmuramoyl-L-alanine amidase